MCKKQAEHKVICFWIKIINIQNKGGICYICISMPSWSFSDMELLALFVSSLGHDLDHRGTNNQYQMSSVSKARPQTRHGVFCMFSSSPAKGFRSTLDWKPLASEDGMFCMLMICVSYTVSYIHVHEKFCIQGYFCPLGLVQDSAPF